MFTTDTAHKAFTYKLHRPQQTADICRQWGVCHLHTPPLPTPLREQFATGTKLPLQFAFSMHPQSTCFQCFGCGCRCHSDPRNVPGARRPRAYKCRRGSPRCWRMPPSRLTRCGYPEECSSLCVGDGHHRCLHNTHARVLICANVLLFRYGISCCTLRISLNVSGRLNYANCCRRRFNSSSDHFNLKHTIAPMRLPDSVNYVSHMHHG